MEDHADQNSPPLKDRLKHNIKKRISIKGRQGKKT